VAGIRLPSRARLRAIVRQRCPQCLEGQVFSGIIRMKDRCTLCGHQFIREPGYFQGAMYVSYGLALITLGIEATVALLLLPSHSPGWALAIAVPLFLPLVPALFRYSRVLWMHIFYYAF
jgi:uncharacterized protein (DUF983 family)